MNCCISLLFNCFNDLKVSIKEIPSRNNTMNYWQFVDYSFQWP